MAAKNNKTRAKGIDKYSLKLVAVQAAFWLTNFYAASFGLVASFPNQWHNIPLVIYARAAEETDPELQVAAPEEDEQKTANVLISPTHLELREASQAAAFWNDLLRAILDATDSARAASNEAQIE
jgi:hypothetical protein